MENTPATDNDRVAALGALIAAKRICADLNPEPGSFADKLVGAAVKQLLVSRSWKKGMLLMHNGKLTLNPYARGGRGSGPDHNP